MFSHNFRSTIFAGVAVGRDFLKQCEISRFAKFRNLRNFPGYKISQPGNFYRLQNSSDYEFSHKLQNSACALFIFFLPFHFPTTFRFLHSINFSIFFCVTTTNHLYLWILIRLNSSAALNYLFKPNPPTPFSFQITSEISPPPLLSISSPSPTQPL